MMARSIVNCGANHERPLLTLRRFACRATLVVFVLLASGECRAGEVDTDKALAEITDTAAKICNTIPTAGERDRLDVNGNAKAELKGLLKRLGDSGISGTGQYTHDEYVGVLQEQLAAALKTNSDCKLTVFMTLQAKLLAQSTVAAGWYMSPEQAESLRIRLTSIASKLPAFIKCRTNAPDCERLAYVLYDVLQRANWPVAEPMTTRGGNVMMTGERGIMVIATSDSARKLKVSLQARDVGPNERNVRNLQTGD